MADDDSAFARERRALVAEIEAEARDTAGWTGRPRYADRVLAAIGRVPRHRFVPAGEGALAYVNRPLAIGYGQTISQPYIVALMSDLLDLAPTDRVLEIGTGCGYQTAVLAELAGRVYSMEVVDQLAEAADRRLAALGYANVTLRRGDGYAGWPEEAPFDAIVVTAAPPCVPDALAEQLAPGGRLVLPIGRAHETQMLCRCVKTPEGRLLIENKLPVAFVPMVTNEAKWRVV